MQPGMQLESETDLNALLAIVQSALRDPQECRNAFVPALSLLEASWPGILEYALKHGLAGLLYRTISKLDFISPAILAPIREAALEQASRNCFLVGELLEILSIFGRLQIEAVALKGPELALRFYGHLSTREFYDLDILVHPADIERARTALEERGYHAPPITSSIADLSRRGHNHLTFVRHDGAAEVEIHWALNTWLERAALEQTGIWSRVRGITIANQPVPVLCIEDTLLFLCIHGFKHRWSRLNWLIDIAYIVRSQEALDWGAVIRRSREVGCYRILLSGLGLAASLLGSVIPPDVEQLIQADPSTFNLVEQVRSAILHARPIAGPDAILYTLRARECLRDHLVLTMRLFRRIWRLTAEDGVNRDRLTWRTVEAACKRPIRLYKTFGLTWVKPVFRLR